MDSTCLSNDVINLISMYAWNDAISIVHQQLLYVTKRLKNVPYCFFFDLESVKIGKCTSDECGGCYAYFVSDEKRCYHCAANYNSSMTRGINTIK